MNGLASPTQGFLLSLGVFLPRCQHMAARALELVALTAARSAKVRCVTRDANTLQSTEKPEVRLRIRPGRARHDGNCAGAFHRPRVERACQQAGILLRLRATVADRSRFLQGNAGQTYPCWTVWPKTAHPTMLGQVSKLTINATPRKQGLPYALDQDHPRDISSCRG